MAPRTLAALFDRWHRNCVREQGVQSRYDTQNVFGWKRPNGQCIGFTSWLEGIDVTASKLRNYYVDVGRTRVLS
jgi:hypothetical protein